MIDYQNLPQNAKVDWFMQPTSGSEVHTWTKPSGCNFVYMIAVGGGGGAQAGTASGTTGSGGTGGGAATFSSLLVPAFLIPDTLFLKIGDGGAGATGSGTFGTSGNPTIISAYRVSSATEYYLSSTGGNGGGRTVSAAPAITGSTLGSIGKFQSSAGQLGGTGATGNGASITFSYILCSGASGAGNNGTIERIGGSILSPLRQATALTVVSGGGIGGTNGGDGFWIPKRFAFYGGAGGGSSITGAGGNGGNGGPGSGGGGGGAGTTGGTGGNGGDGFAIIISY